jgi:DNA mismatch repair protein MutS
MAGMPPSVVRRANEILSELENNHRQGDISKPVGDLAQHREGYQLSFFQLDDPVLQQIRDQIVNLDINNLTPVDALNKLNEIKRIAGLK